MSSSSEARRAGRAARRRRAPTCAPASGPASATTASSATTVTEAGARRARRAHPRRRPGAGVRRRLGRGPARGAGRRPPSRRPRPRSARPRAASSRRERGAPRRASPPSPRPPRRCVAASPGGLRPGRRPGHRPRLRGHPRAGRPRARGRRRPRRRRRTPGARGPARPTRSRRSGCTPTWPPSPAVAELADRGVDRASPTRPSTAGDAVVETDDAAVDLRLVDRARPAAGGAADEHPDRRPPLARPLRRRPRRCASAGSPSLLGLHLTVTGVAAAVGDLLEVRGAAGPVPVEVVASEPRPAHLPAAGRHHRPARRRPRRARTGDALRIAVGEELRGRVLDGLGRPIDGGPSLDHLPRVVGRATRPARAAAGRASTDQLGLGVRALDALTPCGRGQRVGIMAGSGVGKSSLLSMIARGTDAEHVGHRPGRRAWPRGARVPRERPRPRGPGPLRRRRRHLRRAAGRAAARGVRRHPDRRVVPRHRPRTSS